jgi:hypothetical protein
MSAMNKRAQARWRSPGLMGRAIAFAIVLAMNLNVPASRVGWAEDGAKGIRQAAASDKVVRIDNFTFIPDRLVVRAG